MAMRWLIWAAIFVLLFGAFSSVSDTPAKIVAGAVSNVVSAVFSWIGLTNSTPKPVSSRSMINFEAGYVVETVFDGSKLGIEPYAVAVTSDGELLILDAENSNIHQIPTPFSQFCRAKLLAGSPEGYSGHVDGKLREARMSHPKGLTVDYRGNIYIADTKNMAIRKITDTGVTTIAGGKWRRSGHVDGPSEYAKFSNDFDVIYVGSSCSLIVIDRGNQAIREIQLPPHDCSNNYHANFLLGMVVLSGAGFFGYLLACLQWRVSAIFSAKNNPRVEPKKAATTPPYQRHPFIPHEEEAAAAARENIICSLCKLFFTTGSSAAEIFMGLLLGTGWDSTASQNPHRFQVNKHTPSGLCTPERFAIPHERRFWGRWADESGDRWEEHRWEPNKVIFGEVQEED